jgi:hypothetical protein
MMRSMVKIGFFLFVFALFIGVVGSSPVLQDTRESPSVNPVIDTIQADTFIGAGSTAESDWSCLVMGTSSSTVTLGDGSVSATAANSGQRYDVDRRTALGALIASGASYIISDSYYSEYGSLFVESINGRKGQGTKGWMYQVNGGTPGVGANVCTVGNGDQVVWYWSEGMSSTPATSDQVIRLTVAFPTTVPTTVKTTVSTTVKTTVPTTVRTTVPTTEPTTVRTTVPTTVTSTVRATLPAGVSVTSSDTNPTAMTTTPTQTAVPEATSSLPATGSTTLPTSTSPAVLSPTDQAGSVSAGDTSVPITSATTATGGDNSDVVTTTHPVTSARQVNTTTQTVSTTGVATGGMVNATPASNDLGNRSTPNATSISTDATTSAVTGTPATTQPAPVAPWIAIVAVVLGLLFAWGRKQG